MKNTEICIYVDFIVQLSYVTDIPNTQDQGATRKAGW